MCRKRCAIYALSHAGTIPNSSLNGIKSGMRLRLTTSSMYARLNPSIWLFSITIMPYQSLDRSHRQRASHQTDPVLSWAQLTGGGPVNETVGPHVFYAERTKNLSTARWTAVCRQQTSSNGIGHGCTRRVRPGN